MSSVSSLSSSFEEDTTIGNPDVTTMYRTAGDIANRVLAEIVKAAVPGKSIAELCELGDTSIEEALKGVYKKKVMDAEGEMVAVEKGICFPTCVSVNEVAAFFAPFNNEDRALAEGDVAKITLGVHISGYTSTVGHTVVVGGATAEGKTADVLAATEQAAQIALRLLRPGTSNFEITEAINAVAADYGVTPLEGVLSHKCKRFVLDHHDTIQQRPTPENRVDEFQIGVNEVYAIDIVFSTGEGATKASELRTTVFKRAVENDYRLKLKASRALFNQVNKRFPALPFSLRAFDPKIARAGVREMINHQLVHEYPVVLERTDGAIIAQTQFTVLVTANGVTRVTEHAPAAVNTDKKLTNEKLIEVSKRALKRRNKKKKKKAKK